MRPGARNLITDVAGLRVGNADDAVIKTGTTVLTADAPFVASVHVMGGGPGTRETDLLAPENTVQEVDALVLSGGSAFGLAAATGVADALRRAGRGFMALGHNVPIVPAAILFDLANGGDKAWDENPYPALGAAALADAGVELPLGSVGAGVGATTDRLKGGLGSASFVLDNGVTVGALVAVNALGSATVGESKHFWAAPFEQGDEFGGLGPSAEAGQLGGIKPLAGPGQNTTIAIVATDAALTKAEARRVAIAAHDGIGRAVVPAHTPLDGDLVFAAATGARVLQNGSFDVAMIGHTAALCLARAIARGVYHATQAPGDQCQTWADKYSA